MTETEGFQTTWAQDVDALINQLDEELDIYATKLDIPAPEPFDPDEKLKADVAYVIENLQGEQAWRVGNMLFEALAGRLALARSWAK